MTVDPIPFRAYNKLVGGKSLEIGGPMDIRILNSIFAESLEDTASMEGRGTPASLIRIGIDST
jgi:hypothetical protein